MVLLVTVVFLLPTTVYSLTGVTGWPSGQPAVVLALVAGVAALHLRHALADGRPAHWRVTLLMLTVLVYAPMNWLSWNWVAMQWFLIASVGILVGLRVAVVTGAVIVAGTVAAQLASTVPALPDVETIVSLLYWPVGMVLAAIALYGSARLLRVAEELRATRAELSRAAVERERLRVSRDLHDLLGQSLSAVSLKGDLALALLDRDAPAARAEIQGLTAVARDALHGIRAVTRDEHRVSLHTECQGAATLLTAAGIHTSIDIGPAPIPPPADAMLGWAVREGVTNVLRHSDAQRCSITLTHPPGRVRLEIVNDGASSPGRSGGGLAGMTDRARSIEGTVAVERSGRRFRLIVDVPEESP
jgi:two-component system, NarL family, sensor histidine kinase DesK